MGHVEYYDRLFGEMKIPLPSNTRIMLGNMENQRKYNGNYQALPKSKRKRSELKFANIKDGMKKQMADKAMGMNYESGLNMCGEQNIKKTVCKACGASTHKTRRAKACTYFGWSEKDFQDEIVRLNVSTATMEAVGVATAVDSLKSVEEQCEGK